MAADDAGCPIVLSDATESGTSTNDSSEVTGLEDGWATDTLLMIWEASPSGSDFVEESGIAWLMDFEVKELLDILGLIGLELTMMQSSSEASGVGVLRSCGISGSSVDGM